MSGGEGLEDNHTPDVIPHFSVHPVPSYLQTYARYVTGVDPPTQK